jgi:predicted DCC family thiol-disulfide oxidoreductase YuxK
LAVIDMAEIAVAPLPAFVDVDRPALTVLYDWDCGLCQATVKQLRRWDQDGRLAMLALQSAPDSDDPAIRSAAAGSPLASALHVVAADGRVFAGGDAALAIIHELPGGHLLDPWRSVAPFRWVIGAGYDLVADHRHEIGRALRLEGPACDVPPVD